MRAPDSESKYQELIERLQSFMARNRLAFNVLQVVFVTLIVLCSFLILLNEDVRNSLSSYGAIGAFVANLLSSASVILPAPGLLFSCVSSGSGVGSAFAIGLSSAAGSTLGETTAYVIGYTGRTANPAGTGVMRRFARRTLPYGSRRRLVLARCYSAVFGIGVVRYSVKKCAVPVAKVRRFFDSEKQRDKLEYLVARYGGPTLFLLSVLPLPFFDLAGIIAGGFRYPLMKFYLWVLPGKAIKFVLVALACQFSIEWITGLLGG